MIYHKEYTFNISPHDQEWEEKTGLDIIAHIVHNKCIHCGQEHGGDFDNINYAILLNANKVIYWHVRCHAKKSKSKKGPRHVVLDLHKKEVLKP